MSHLEALGQEALSLPDSERANLAAQLLSSLPLVLAEEDGDLAEVRRRNVEFDRDPRPARSRNEFVRGGRRVLMECVQSPFRLTETTSATD